LKSIQRIQDFMLRVNGKPAPFARLRDNLMRKLLRRLGNKIAVFDIKHCQQRVERLDTIFDFFFPLIIHLRYRELFRIDPGRSRAFLRFRVPTYKLVSGRRNHRQPFDHIRILRKFFLNHFFMQHIRKR